MDILAIFVERVKELMFDENMKSEGLGKSIGTDGSTVRRWLRTDSRPNLNNLIALAEHFHCSIEFLTGRSEKLLDFTPQSPLPFTQGLRRVLAERGMSRYFLDKNTKFKDSYFYSWDHGAIPDIFTVCELADLLECTVDYLVRRER
jgi:transcriptional regulator with XRE-family HTH domain